MNQLATNNERLPMDSVGMSTGSTGAKIAPQNLAEVVKFAEVMCRADIALPKHLRGNAGACMAVSLQALDWQMNPFAVASKSYQVNGQIAYEAQLIIAVINTRSGIEGRLEYRFEGEGAEKVCIASGKLDGKILEVRSPKFKDITPKNSPLWKSDPDQQHCYYTGRAWGRRHTPEVILGVYDRDEVESFTGPDNAKDVTPQPSVMQRLRAAQEAPQQAVDEREGFDASFVHSETETALTGEIIDNTDTDEIALSQSVDAGMKPAEGEVETPPAASPSNDPERDILIRFAAEMLPMAANINVSPSTLKEVEKGWSEGEMKSLTDAGKEKARSISMSIRAIANGKASLESAREFYAEMLGCKPSDLGASDE
ncbi:MAG: hypothetical protein AAGD15_01590 [Agrobacterium cavarae]|uniref:hypothetical protein n=1 Tax=Agrobacterium cavarae TaxID=2528239 RepID=UPI0031ACE249